MKKKSKSIEDYYGCLKNIELVSIKSKNMEEEDNLGLVRLNVRELNTRERNLVHVSGCLWSFFYFTEENRLWFSLRELMNYTGGKADYDNCNFSKHGEKRKTIAALRKMWKKLDKEMLEDCAKILKRKCELSKDDIKRIAEKLK